VECAHDWVLRAATLLKNSDQKDALRLRRDYRRLLSDVAQARRGDSAFLAACATQFVKVSQSYWSGLFCCYEQPDLPRTNNDTEQCLGSFRYHQRRATGRKTASAATVVRGQVRLLAATVLPPKPLQGEQLRPKSLENWRKLRRELDQKQETRTQQKRFRKDPKAFLKAIEDNLRKTFLPP